MIAAVNAAIQIQSVTPCHVITALRQPDIEDSLQRLEDVLDFSVVMIHNPFAASDPHNVIQTAVRLCCHAEIADALRCICNRRVIEKAFDQNGIFFQKCFVLIEKLIPVRLNVHIASYMSGNS